MNTSKVANTPKNKTPKSAKKKGSAVKAQVDTPRPNLPAKKVPSAKKQNGLKSAATPKSKSVTTKTPPKSNKKKPVVKKDEEDDDDEEEEDEEMDVDHIKELVMASDDDDDDEEEEDDDEEEEDDDDDDDDEIDEKDLEAMLKAIRGKETKKAATPAKTPKEEKTKKAVTATPAKTPKAGKGKDTEAKTPKKAEEVAPAKTPKGDKAKKTEAAATPAKTPKDNKAKKTEAATPAKKADTAMEADAGQQNPIEDLQGAYQEQLKFFNERNKRTLFVKQLPSKITESELSKLSSDILVVRMRKSRDSSVYAFVEFKDEATAQKNFKTLSECKFEGNPIFVDFASTKSTSEGPKGNIGKLDPKKLYITGFPQKTTLEDLQKVLPNAQVTLPVKTSTNVPLGYAFAKFEIPDLCSEALKQVQGKVLHGTPLIALYAKLVPLSKEIKRKLDEPKGDPDAKKRKLVQKKEGNRDAPCKFHVMFYTTTS
eukprot:XP_014777594.1 PREDICTED: nucleolin-like [Octopus bimaculoides]